MLAWWLYATNLSGQWVRVISWVTIGLFVGLAEGLSWRPRSMDSKTKRADQRFLKSLGLGGVAGLIAAFIVEIVRTQLKNSSLGGYEDVISFSILGAALGVGLSLAAAPNYALEFLVENTLKNVFTPLFRKFLINILHWNIKKYLKQ